jgi:hypothetical protein
MIMPSRGSAIHCMNGHFRSYSPYFTGSPHNAISK